MYIQRDISTRLSQHITAAQIVIGPRQCGKSTLLEHVASEDCTVMTLDDLQLRQLANQDPALFLNQFKPPLILDEIQYAPNLFPALKQAIDQHKKQRLRGEASTQVLFRITGSNQILLDENVKESLAGRASFFNLNTLTVHELINSSYQPDIATILFKGGWPELYIDSNLAVVQYLNDYIVSYIEKDIVLSAGIQKTEAFTKMLGLLAARTGTLLDCTALASDSGIKSVTIKDWLSVLQRSGLVYCLKPYASNLNKRLTRTPKLYFLDSGLAARLQAWQDPAPMLLSPHAGPLFETLVFAEIYKCIQNHGLPWQLYFWRTKEGEEIDFLIITETGKVIALDAKLGMQGVRRHPLPASVKTTFPDTTQLVLVTFGGKSLQLADDCLALPISALHDFLLNQVGSS